MGCVTSSIVQPDVEQNSHADRFRVFSETPLVHELLGFYEEDVKALFNMCTFTKQLKLGSNIALVVVVTGEIHATLSLDDKLKVKAKTLTRGDVIPFFLCPEHYQLSSDGTAFIFNNSTTTSSSSSSSSSGGAGGSGHSVKLRFRFNNTRAATGGSILTLSKEKLDAFLSTRDRLKCMHSLLRANTPRLLQTSKELKGLPESWARALIPLLDLRAFEDGDLLLFWTNVSAQSLAAASKRSGIETLSISSSGGKTRSSEESSGGENSNSITGHKEHPSLHNMSIVLMGNAAVMDTTVDVEAIITKLRERRHITQDGQTHDGNSLPSSKLHIPGGGRYSPGVSFDGAVNWSSQGHIVSAGTAVGVEMAFLKPPVSLSTIFGAGNGITACILRETIEALERLDSRMVLSWRNTFCFNALNNFKSSIRLLANLSDENTAFLSDSAQLLMVPAGASVCNEGEDAQFFHIILDGEVEETSSKDKDATFILHGGDYFSEVNLVTDAPYTVSRKALSTVVMMVIKKEHFMEVFSKDQKTLIEIKLRSMGGETELIYILRHSIGSSMLLKFLEKEFATENLLFWQTVEAFEKAVRGYQRQTSSLRSADMSTTTAEMTTLSSISASRDEEEEKSFERLSPLRNSHSRNASSANELLSATKQASTKKEALPISEIIRLAENIISDFIVIGGKSQVNIPGRMRDGIEASYKAFKATSDEVIKSEARVELSQEFSSLFTLASKEVYELLKKDGFVRWKQSPEFSEFLKQIKFSKNRDVKAKRLTDIVALEAYAEATRKRHQGTVSNVALQSFREKSFREKSTSLRNHNKPLPAEQDGGGAKVLAGSTEP